MQNNNLIEKLRNVVVLLGPGIMMATAAVGGSHLVASTQSGALYGWQLLWVIALVNLLKYPFFRAGVQYTLATGNSLVQGYDQMGRGYLLLFTVLAIISGVINIAALTIFSANLLTYFLPFQIHILVLSVIILIVCLVILLCGHYKALDGISKVIMLSLTIATIAAVWVAFGNEPAKTAEFKSPSIFSLNALGFIVIMMGWMPAPIEISSVTSLWLKSQMRLKKVTNKSALLDFNIGYFVTAVLALFFLALGALVLHGNGEEMQTTGVGFTAQLISLYASTIGEWSRNLIAVIAFFCIFGSTITVIDGYARSVSEASRLFQNKPEECRKSHQLWMASLSAFGVVVLVFFTSHLMEMLEFAMIMAFMTTPIFAWLNYKLMFKSQATGVLALGKKLNLLCIIGLIYLFGFLAVFIWWKWLS